MLSGDIKHCFFCQSHTSEQPRPTRAVSDLTVQCDLHPIENFVYSSFTARLLIRRSGALQQTFYGSPTACPVLGFLHYVNISPANCRSSLT